MKTKSHHILNFIILFIVLFVNNISNFAQCKISFIGKTDDSVFVHISNVFAKNLITGETATGLDSVVDLSSITNITNVQRNGDQFKLNSNFPNSFDNFTQFELYTPTEATIDISLYDIMGRKLASYSDKYYSGSYTFQLQADNIPAGMYILAADNGNQIQTIQIVKHGNIAGGECNIKKINSNLPDNSIVKSAPLKSASNQYSFTGQLKCYFSDTIYIPLKTCDTTITFSLKEKPQTYALKEQIIIDQFGWRPDDKKIAVFANPIKGLNSCITYIPGDTFYVKRLDDNVTVFKGLTTSWKNKAVDPISGDQVWNGDFSELKTPGEYYIYDSIHDLKSYTFEIREDVFNQVQVAACRMYYYQRCGTEIPEKFGGPWHHPRCHAKDTAAIYYYDKPLGNPKNLAGGWHDDGSAANKYLKPLIIPDAIFGPVMSYEINPEAYTDSTNIPESGNGIPDILDELKWGTDWLLKIQDSTGGAYSRNCEFYKEVSFEKNNQPRYYLLSSTWSTSSYAALLAHVARVFAANDSFKNTYPGYSDSVLNASKRAWAYLVKHPSMYPEDGSEHYPENPFTGDKKEDKGLRVWAAAELFKSTGDTTYNNYFKATYNDYKNTSQYGFHPLDPNTYYFEDRFASYINKAFVVYMQTQGADSTIVSKLKLSLKNGADRIVNAYLNKTDPYGSYLVDWKYSWASNLYKALAGGNLIYAIMLNVNPDRNNLYKEVAEEYLHYLHGKNALSYCYLSNMGNKAAPFGGDKSPMEIFHIWFMTSSLYNNASSTYGPAPGFLVCGPDGHDFDDKTISPPYGEPFMKAFKDGRFNEWYIFTESALELQGPYIMLVSYFTKKK